MKNYVVMVLVENGDTRSQHWAIRMEESDADILALVRSLVDACRCLLHGSASVPAVIVWEVEGHLSAFSKLRIYQSPDLMTQPNARLIGARQNSAYNPYTGFKVVRDSIIGRGPEHFMYGTLGPVDMAQFREGPHLNISTDGPLWQVAFPMFAAFLDQWPELDRIKVDLQGVVSERETVTSGWKLGNPQHQHKQHLKWERLTVAQRAIRGRVAQACKTMRRACLKYQNAMETFDHRWGDNHTPPQGHYASYWLDAINSAALWFDLAKAMDWQHIPDPNKGYSYTLSRNIGGGNTTFSNFDQEQWSAAPSMAGFTPDAHAPIVASCIQAMYSAQRTLEAERALCEAEFTDPTGNRTARKDVIAELTAIWAWFVFDEDGDVRMWFAERNDRPPDHPEAFIVKYRCQRQQEAEAAYIARGGASYGLQCAQSHEAMSHALMVANNALHLLLAFCRPQPPDAETWERSGAASSVKDEGVHYFSKVEPTEAAYDLIGNPCNFIDTRSWASVPWLTEVLPCSDPVDVDRLPYPRGGNMGNGHFWDNSIHVDNLAQAIQARIVGAVQGHKDESHIFYDPRTGQYSVGETPPPGSTDAFPHL